jgi:hypothetical protein
MVLNTIDYKENPDFQSIMNKSMYERVLNNVKSAYDVLARTEQRKTLSEELNLLPKNLPLYFYGVSFGGCLGVRFAEEKSGTFKAYMCHDSALARQSYREYIRPDDQIKKLKENILILQNYTDKNTLLHEQIDFYEAVKKMRKTHLIRLYFFPQANLEADQVHNIGHGFSNELWYLEEYAQAVLDFIEATKFGCALFTSPLPGSVQAMRLFFHKTAFQEHANKSSQFDRFISIGFKIYKNALEWRDVVHRKNLSFKKNEFMKRWFKIYSDKKKITIVDNNYARFLEKALDILSNDNAKADGSWNDIYLNIIQEPNIKYLNELPHIVASLSVEMNTQLEIIYDKHRKALVKTLKKHQKLIYDVIMNKMRNSGSLALNRLGDTALHRACKEGLYNAVKLYLRSGADPNCKNNSDQTPLHIACFQKNENIVRLLLKKGADVNAVNMDGETPLHDACSETNLSPKNWVDIIKLLLKKGANPTIENYDKKKPGDLTTDTTIKTLLE